MTRRFLAAVAAAVLVLAGAPATATATAPARTAAPAADRTPIHKPLPGQEGRRAAKLAGPNFHYADGYKDITTTSGTGATQVAAIASQ